MEKTMDKIVALCNARGFIYPGSQIYGGLANTWDYGNLGVELKNNVKKAWWQKFVQESPENVGVDKLFRSAHGLQSLRREIPCRQADRGLRGGARHDS